MYARRRNAKRQQWCHVTHQSTLSMASTEGDLFQLALYKSQEKLNEVGIDIKEKQYQVLLSIVKDNNYKICVLPTGYGKSLIYHVKIMMKTRARAILSIVFECLDVPVSFVYMTSQMSFKRLFGSGLVEFLNKQAKFQKMLYAFLCNSHLY